MPPKTDPDYMSGSGHGPAVKGAGRPAGDGKVAAWKQMIFLLSETPSFSAPRS